MTLKMLKVKKLSEYKKYADFYASNIHKVSSQAQILIPNIKEFMQVNLKEMVFLDQDVLDDYKWEWPVKKFALWKDIEHCEHSLFIFFINKQIIGFLLLEKTKHIRYLFVEEEYRKNGYGTKILNRVRNHKIPLRLKIEDNEFLSGLGFFYEKNSFIKVNESFYNGTKYHHYEEIFS